MTAPGTAVNWAAARSFPPFPLLAQTLMMARL
jgi:hypothetical protein